MQTDVRIRRDEDGWAAHLHAEEGDRAHELVIGGHVSLDLLASAVEERLSASATSSPLDLAHLRQQWRSMLDRTRARDAEPATA